ncbi:hypothetical protein J437_LFUL019493 [Ladona fulva]|uniref:Uncharacterized protein n=1 Tax=Ladona fulva TaxID=123851 RepID=A0A8K0PCL8_LADFU|nr:hypothetical protein J437_LFUL019493 [Ladona fulva]
MSLKPHLDYRAKPDLIVGFEDHGFLGRSWSSRTKSEVLITLMEEVLWQSHKTGLYVSAVVCDMGNNYVKTLKTMGATID